MDGSVKLQCPDPAPKLVFITSQMYQGNLGGLAGADAHCQTLANAAGLTGVFKAWLSDSVNSPSTRFTHTLHEYILRTGTLVSYSYADLITTGPLVAIDIDEKGEGIGNPAAWTSTNPNGTSRYLPTGTIDDCTDWTSSSNSGRGWTSSTLSGGSNWTLSEESCNGQSLLYCFQQ